jgi:hypothetical protein
MNTNNCAVSSYAQRLAARERSNPRHLSRLISDNNQPNNFTSNHDDTVMSDDEQNEIHGSFYTQTVKQPSSNNNKNNSINIINLIDDDEALDTLDIDQIVTALQAEEACDFPCAQSNSSTSAPLDRTPENFQLILDDLTDLAECDEQLTQIQQKRAEEEAEFSKAALEAPASELNSTEFHSLMARCLICYEPLSTELVFTLCGHVFHSQCTKESFQGCPACQLKVELLGESKKTTQKPKKPNNSTVIPSRFTKTLPNHEEEPSESPIPLFAQVFPIFFEPAEVINCMLSSEEDEGSLISFQSTDISALSMEFQRLLSEKQRISSQITQKTNEKFLIKGLLHEKVNDLLDEQEIQYNLKKKSKEIGGKRAKNNKLLKNLQQISLELGQNLQFLQQNLEKDPELAQIMDLEAKMTENQLLKQALGAGNDENPLKASEHHEEIDSELNFTQFSTINTSNLLYNNGNSLEKQIKLLENSWKFLENQCRTAIQAQNTARGAEEKRVSQQLSQIKAKLVRRQSELAVKHRELSVLNAELSEIKQNIKKIQGKSIQRREKGTNQARYSDNTNKFTQSAILEARAAAKRLKSSVEKAAEDTQLSLWEEAEDVAAEPALSKPVVIKPFIVQTNLSSNIMKRAFEQVGKLNCEQVNNFSLTNIKLSDSGDQSKGSSNAKNNQSIHLQQKQRGLGLSGASFLKSNNNANSSVKSSQLFGASVKLSVHQQQALKALNKRGH